MSARRACAVIQAGRTSDRYKSRRDDQASLRKKIREIAETRVRYGYRGVHVLLLREGWKVNVKRVYRNPAMKPNEVWAMDFVSDQTFDVRQRYRGSDVVETLERVTRQYGKPKTIRVDNGPEFISKDLDLWAYMNGVTLDSIENIFFRVPPL
ncbi:MAG: IS3 family transposase [Magnetovibrio sp.]|nr:IS3 family transposase [Magnetovibrio sp.]